MSFVRFSPWSIASSRCSGALPLAILLAASKDSAIIIKPFLSILWRAVFAVGKVSSCFSISSETFFAKSSVKVTKTDDEEIKSLPNATPRAILQREDPALFEEVEYLKNMIRDSCLSKDERMYYAEQLHEVKKIIREKENEIVKSIKKLKDKKYRDEENKFIVEGIKMVQEAIKENAKISKIVICEDCINDGSIKQELLYEIAKHDCIYVSQKVFQTITDVTNPQGLLAEFR